MSESVREALEEEVVGVDAGDGEVARRVAELLEAVAQQHGLGRRLFGNVPASTRCSPRSPNARSTSSPAAMVARPRPVACSVEPVAHAGRLERPADDVVQVDPADDLPVVVEDHEGLHQCRWRADVRDCATASRWPARVK